MAIFQLQQVNPNLSLATATIEEKIGYALYRHSFNHFTQFLGQPGLGLSYNSCNAAVAINFNPNYDQVNTIPFCWFSVVYGSSRLFTGLDPDFNAIHPPQPGRQFSSSLQGEHAEQSAIRVATAQGLAFWNHIGHNHIYIDLIPCGNCDTWLRNRPENWYVHFYGPPVVNAKKRDRSQSFGRITERPSKRAKTKT